jgi:hypothetical protein
VDISRIEVIYPKDIQEIGKEYFANIAGGTVRLIRPEDFAPVRKLEYAEEKLYMLTLKKSEAPLGLLVKKVLDKIDGAFDLDTGQIYSDFVSGTSVFDEKILIFLNPAAIAEHVENDKISGRIVKKGRMI